MHHASVHAYYTSHTLAELWTRGVRAMPHPNAFLFSDETGRRVATAVRMDLSQSAFTRGDLGLSDNFDAADGRTVAVENCTFGACKLLLERHQARAFVATGDAEALARFAKYDGVAEDPAFLEAQRRPESREARAAFLEAMAARHLRAVDEAVLRLGKAKQALQADPLYAFCKGRDLADSSLEAYLQARTALLPLLLQANPRFAKLAVGRTVWFPLVERLWSPTDPDALDLSIWSVVLARRCQLARHPDLAYTFLMLHCYGDYHCETSDKDDLWALQVMPPEEGSGPLDWLLPQNGMDALAEAMFWDRIAAAAPTRKLGRANALVARSLMGQLSDAERRLEAEAKAWLERIAWAQWFDSALPGHGSVLDPPSLPQDLLLAVGTADGRAWLEALTQGLPSCQHGAQDAPA